MFRQNSETAIDVMLLTGAYICVGLLILEPLIDTAVQWFMVNLTEKIKRNLDTTL